MESALSDAIQECCSNLGITKDDFDMSWQSYALNNGIDIDEMTQNRLQSFRTMLLSQAKRKQSTVAATPMQKDLSSGGISLLLSGMSSEGQAASVNKGEVVYKFGEVDYMANRLAGQLTAPNDDMDMYKAFFVNSDATKEALMDEVDATFATFQSAFKTKAADNKVEIEFGPADSLTQSDIVTFGRVLILSSSELNEELDDLASSQEKQAVLLLPTELGRGMAYLEFNDVAFDYDFWKQTGSVFSGQICGLVGRNSNGRSFSVKSILLPKLPAYAPIPQAPSQSIVAVAAGPFLISSNLNALDAALQVINAKDPEYAILIGPFIHESALDSLELFVHDLYDVIISKLLKCSDKSPKTKFIVISSPFEAVSTLCLYPTPPLNENNKQFKKLPKFYFFPSPCTFSIDGVIFGCTSCDVIKGISSSLLKVSTISKKDRISTLCEFVLANGPMPTRPTPEGVNLTRPVSWSITPHVLLTPCILSPFVKKLDFTTCVNPGSVMKMNRLNNITFIQLGNDISTQTIKL